MIAVAAPRGPSTPPHPALIARHGLFVAEAITHFRSPRMPFDDVRFALVRQPTNPLAKPQACVTLGELARTIHRDRKGAPIQLVDDIALNIADWGEVRGVGVWTLTEGGDQHLYIGWAWLNGAAAAALRSALDALQSTAPTIGRGRAA
jgi:hypothetical protein